MPRRGQPRQFGARIGTIGTPVDRLAQGGLRHGASHWRVVPRSEEGNKNMKRAGYIGHIALAGLVVSLLATGTARAAADDDLIDEVVKILERVGEEADANKPDCEKIGTALAKHQAEDAAVMKQAKDSDAKKTPKQREDDTKAAKAKFGERMKAAKAKAAPLKACKANAKVKAYAEQVMR
jgi:hypothetical protein